MKKVAHLVFLGLTLSLSACFDQTVEIKNGMIPAEFRPVAEKLMGVYEGDLERERMSLTFSMNDQGRIQVAPSRDLVGSACESKLGDLNRIYFKKLKSGEIRLTELEFDFNPNHCIHEIRGRNVYVVPKSFGEHPVIQANILEYRQWVYDCNPMSPPNWPDPGHGGIYHPGNGHWNCGWRSVDHWLEGNFTKVEPVDWREIPHFY